LTIAAAVKAESARISKAADEDRKYTIQVTVGRYAFWNYYVNPYYQPLTAGIVS